MSSEVIKAYEMIYNLAKENRQSFEMLCFAREELKFLVRSHPTPELASNAEKLIERITALLDSLKGIA